MRELELKRVREKERDNVRKNVLIFIYRGGKIILSTFNTFPEVIFPLIEITIQIQCETQANCVSSLYPVQQDKTEQDKTDI